MQLSVITVTHRRVPLLLRKAASLAAQTLDAELFEWCVVSNGDGAAEEALEILETPFALRTVVFERNRPVAAARNAAAATARGRVLLLSDDDVLLPPGCLEAHLHAHGGPGPRVVVGALRLPAELEPAPRPTGSDREPEPFERVPSLGGRALWINATGANTSLPRSAFEAVGGYDESFAGYGGEDSDLALRLRNSGAAFVHSSAAWAEHAGLVTGDSDKAFAAGRAGVRVWRKHGGLDVALLLGVHPALLALKRAALATPLARLWGERTAAYERAYLQGAAAELREGASPARAGDGPDEERR